MFFWLSKDTVGQHSFKLLLRNVKMMFQCTLLVLIFHLNLNHFPTEMQSNDALRDIHRAEQFWGVICILSQTVTNYLEVFALLGRNAKKQKPQTRTTAEA
jgi:hypothetical protein